MLIVSTSILSFAILLFSFQSCESAVKLYIQNQCKCEQLLYEEECFLLDHCQYLNHQCVQRACNELQNILSCWSNNKCAWTKNACQDFISCSVQGKDQIDCPQVSKQCRVDMKTQKCIKMYQKSCSQLSQNDCFVGKDGICKYQKNSCSKMTSCESVNYNDISCFMASPACYSNYDTEKCESQMGCQYYSGYNCIIAPADINKESFYICYEDRNQVCQDLDLSIQTVDTCLYDTFGFYHWTGTVCEICKSSQVLLLITIILIIVF